MNQIKIQGVCTCVPQFSYEKDRRGRSVPTCRYILAVQRPKSSYSDYMYCVAFGERAMITFQRIKKGTTVFVQDIFIQRKPGCQQSKSIFRHCDSRLSADN